MSRYLITGKNGFCGRKLEAFLKQEGNDVYGLPREFLDNLPILVSYINEIKPDIIIHTAAYGNLASQDNKAEVLFTNELKTLILLEALQGVEYQKFIFFSSSSVYGKPYQNMAELDQIYPNTLYGITKANAERIVLSYPRTVVIRPSTIIGPGDNPEHLLPKMIEYAKSGKILPFVPSPVHDYIHVDDVCSAINILLQNDATGIYNVGTGIETSNLELVPIVERMTKKPVNLEYRTSMRDYDNDHWSVNNNKIKDLGWHPEKTIDDAVFEILYEK